MFPKEFQEIVHILSSCPSITQKQAKKIATFLLDKKDKELLDQLNYFISCIEKINKCTICGFYANNELCNICSSKNRQRKLMIVENIFQIEKYENEKIFDGKYYVIPYLFTKKMERISKNFDFNFLLKYISEFDEIILALSPTPEGFLTANLIFDTIKNKMPNLKISQLAIGVPLGSSIDYVDQLTLSHAIKNRKDIK